jgi:acyl-CoA thioesterase-1
MKRTHKRNRISIAVAAILLVSLCTVCASPLVSAAGGSSTNVQAFALVGQPTNAHLIVCVGDSITAGYPDYTSNWPHQLEMRLGNNWTVINQGVNGDTTSGLLARIDNALALKPRYVIVAGGVSDMIHGVPTTTTESNISAICERITLSGGVPVLCTATPTTAHYAQTDTLNAWIKGYAGANGYAVIDFYPVINDPANPGNPNPALVVDGIHPNPAGYTAMGNAINLAIFTGGT